MSQTAIRLKTRVLPGHRIEVTAPELCNSVVSEIPTTIAKNWFLLNRFNRCETRLAKSFSRDWLAKVMPYMKIAMPPRSNVQAELCKSSIPLF